MTSYRVVLEKKAVKALAKMDSHMSRLIRSWLRKNLEGCADPRRHGKALKANLREYWRYRVGDYRLLARIDDDTVVIYIMELADRKEIYRRK
jgi:mRNA interferase RelE/StbE